MSALNTANIKKTIYYLQRNGLRNTWYAIQERLAGRKASPYVYTAPSSAELKAQREAVLGDYGKGIYDGIHFSIVVPAYRTKPQYLRELVKSLKEQSYPFWELIIADATEDNSVRKVLEELKDIADVEPADSTQAKHNRLPGSIRYLHLESNMGISENTNRALPYAKNEYIGLLDHDDILTPDALYEMAKAIRKAREQGQEVQLIYSDEDKCNEDGTLYYEPNFKEKFNYDLILSNNYICHFMIIKSELIQKLGFRKEFDGAQDYDLVLRAVSELGIPKGPAAEAAICHVPKVLYHWRCHASSTAENPHSKEYAYEAGRQALQEHANQCGIPARACHMKHVGFYRLRYPQKIFEARKDVGAVGGPLIRRGRIWGGRMDKNGKVYYANLPQHFSGYLHRAVLTQDAEAVDIRNMAVRPELHELFREVTGVSYQKRPKGSGFDANVLPADTDYKELSLKLSRAVREQGYRILYRRNDE